jgi:hypothetical protein
MRNNKNTSINVGLFTGLLSLVFALPPSPVHAAETVEKTITIYSDSFDGTGALAGSSPVIATDAPSWAQSATWNASTSLTYNAGGYIETPTGTSSNQRLALLPVVMTENSGIYTFTFTYSLSVSSGNAYGTFSRTAANTTDVDTGVNASNVISVNYNRLNGVAVLFPATTSYNSQTSVIAGGINTPLTVSIEINTYDNTFKVDTNGTNWTTVTGTMAKTDYEAIQSLKLGNYNTGCHFYDMSLTLTTLTAVPSPVVPEPETFAALLGIFILLGVASMKFRR